MTDLVLEDSRFDALCPRFRRDVRWIEYSEDRWVAHDTVADTFYYMSQAEKRAAVLMDGKRSVGDIVALLRREFSMSGIDANWLSIFLQKLGASGLMLDHLKGLRGNASGRTRSQLGRSLQSWLWNPLSIRIPLVHVPQSLGRSLEPIARAVFHPWLFGAVVALSAVVWFWVIGKIFQHPEDALYDISHFQGVQWFWGVLAYVVVKSLHELGHTLACIRWGVRSPTLGVLLLCFTPCFYCDTTESWKLKSRWKRASIAAAGIYFELMIATVSALLWMTASSANERSLFAMVFLMCSVGTILINANPLFRYDGYYILCDLAKIPNLGPQASSALRQLFVRTLGGSPMRPKDFDRPIPILALYALASGVYRTIVLCTLLWFLWIWLEPLGLGIVAVLIALVTVYAVVRGVLRFVFGLWTEFWGPYPMSIVRSISFVSLLAALAYLAWSYPLPEYLPLRGYVDYSDRKGAFSTQSAILVTSQVDFSANATRAESPRTVVELDSYQMRLEFLQTQHELRLQRKKLELATNAQAVDENASYEIPILKQIIEELEGKVRLMQAEQESLKILADKDQYFIPVTRTQPRSFTPPHHVELTNYTAGKSNEGRAWERGQQLGWLTQMHRAELVAIVPASEVGQLRLGQSVRVVLDSQTSKVLIGKVERVTASPLDVLPNELAGDFWTVGTRNERGEWVPDQPHHIVTVSLPFEETASDQTSPSPRPVRGNLGTVQIELPPTTIAERVYDYLAKRFRSKR